MRQIRVAAAIAVMLIPAAGRLAANEWARSFSEWHERNELRCWGSANSADLAWWESYLLQSYLAMYQATQDRYWLDRLVAHADTMFSVMRDAPDTGDYWPGYRDGFLGWGTTRYDPKARYQEYLVHDGQICLPVVRFARLVFSTPELKSRYLRHALRYIQVVEQNIVAKWYSNWYDDRGADACLERFGGWQLTPVNQALVFGEVLLVMSEIAKSPDYRAAWRALPDGWYLATADEMAAQFGSELTFRSADSSYTWKHWPATNPDPRPEDLSHANLGISFVCEACTQGRRFDTDDLIRLGNTLTTTMRLQSGTTSLFSRFVDGSGGPDHSGHLKDWLKLGEFHPAVFGLVRQLYQTCPEWSGPAAHACQAATVAALAAASPRSLTEGSDGTATSDGQALPAPTFRAELFRDRLVIWRPSRFTAIVRDCRGRQVSALPVISGHRAGFEAEWLGIDDAGRPVGSGTYFCTVTGTGSSERIKVTLVR